MSGFFAHWGAVLSAAAGISILAVAGMKLTVLGPWYYGLRKPGWKPPDWLFGPAWTTIFICEAIAGVVGWRTAPATPAAWWLVGLLVVNGVLNMLWSWLFFRRQRPDYAQVEVVLLWLSIIAPMAVLYGYAGHAWMLLLPYLLWVSFAACLNHKIVQLNKPFAKAT